MRKSLQLCTFFGTLDAMTERKQLPARFFESETGRAPVREWLLDLSADGRKAIGDDIRTAEFGWPVGMPLCRSDQRSERALGSPDEPK